MPDIYLHTMQFKTFKEIENSTEYTNAPTVIQRAVRNYPPLRAYQYKDQTVTILKYNEPLNWKYSDVTVNVRTATGETIPEVKLTELKATKQ